MPKQAAQLDLVFQGLADSTRRAVLERLSAGPAPVGELARPFKMRLPSFSQHLDVLERAGLVRSRKAGRVRTYHLVPRRLESAQHWLEVQHARWNSRLNQLDNYLETLKEQKL
jgi:DNA-binding transcriptional ArsR family regulator